MEPRTDAKITALVFLLGAMRNRRAALVRALRVYKNPETILSRGIVRLQDQDKRCGDRMLLALRVLDLQVVPFWQLPLAFLDAQPPPALFVRGHVPAVFTHATAIVGARQASAESMHWAKALATELARDHRVIVSGGAYGIDGAAHEGALVGGGVTVAYLGVAIDRIYPAGHKRLFSRIINKGGALVSEFPPGWATWASAHAARNRFIAAHAEHVVVAEADTASGALSTAYWARRLGRRLSVSPPDIAGKRGGIDRLVEMGWVTLP